MLDYIMGAGTYGNVDNLVANKLGDDDDVKNLSLNMFLDEFFQTIKVLRSIIH